MTTRADIAYAMDRWNRAFMAWRDLSEQTITIRYELDLLRAKEQVAQDDLNKARDFYKEVEKRFLESEE